jgi:hypothetical protein
VKILDQPGRNPTRHFLFHGNRMERLVLSEGMKSNDRLAFEVRGREAILWGHRLPIDRVMQNKMVDRAVRWLEFLLFSTFAVLRD